MLYLSTFTINSEKMINKIILLVAFTLVSALSFSQDVIVKKTGDTIEVKIIEITSSLIKYKKFSQLDGPLRNIEIINVREIQYEDGEIESFENHSTELEPSAPDKKDPIHENGLFIEGMFGFSSLTYPINNYNYNTGTTTTSSVSRGEVGIQMRLGSKWYFGSLEKKWRPGVQLTFLRIAIYHDFGFPNSYSLSPLSLGFANVFKFTEKTGLEINANFGFNVMNFVPPIPGAWGNSNWRGDGGIIYGAEVKYRYGSFAVGLDFSRINTFVDNSTRDLVSLSIGQKF